MRTMLLAMAMMAAAISGASAVTRVQTETITVPAAEADRDIEIGYDPDTLPAPVQRVRRLIMETAATGDIERMRPVIEMNEMPPTFSFGETDDPIEHWKQVSGDANGREILAIMVELLESGFAHVEKGRPQEMYVWPYFHEVPFDALTPEQEVELYKIITPQDREQMELYGSYTFYRLGIGPDGTWHFFVAGD